ncbi:MAG: hypothetical protein QHC79_09410 [Pseudosphingobacterium sp.]|nr:hypothetical protein [Pseudosphingobacterium sp.]
MEQVIHSRIGFTWRGRQIIARLEIKKAIIGPVTYTVFANKSPAIYLFRKIEGTWQLVYGSPPDDLKIALIEALSLKFELD